MADPSFVSAVQRAITQAKSVQEVDRLERALETNNPSLVEDIIGSSFKRKSPPSPLQPPAKHPKLAPKPALGLSKLSGLNSITLSLLLDRAKHDPAFPDSTHPSLASEVKSGPLWRSSAEASNPSGHSSLVVEVSSVLCKKTEIPARLVVLDVETEDRLLDLRLQVPTEPAITDGVSLEDAQTQLLALMKGPETFLCTSNIKLPHILRIRHTRWLPTSLIFKPHEAAKKKIAGNHHVRNVVPQWHVRQTLLGEGSDNWHAETVETIAGGTARLIKVGCAKFPAVLDNFLPKHRGDTLWVSKIPRDAEIQTVFAGGKFPGINWHLDTHEHLWLGETAVTFESEEARNKIFDALPGVVDVYVSWDRLQDVNEDTLRQTAGNFGRVSAVRIPARKDAEARPFGFVSFLRPLDAAKMCGTKKITTADGFVLQAHLAQVDKKNPVKRVPLETRVIEIYKM